MTSIIASGMQSLLLGGRLVASPSVHFFSRAASASVAALGFLVLAGWALDVPALKSLHPTLVSMKANTALGFLLSGFALLIRLAKPGRSWSQLSAVSGVVVTLVGALTLSEYLFGFGLGIDQLLFEEAPFAVATSHPGRMAPNTALAFLLLGGALLAPEHKVASRLAASGYLAVLAVAFIALVGYAFETEAFYGLASYTRMAPHTAAAFAAISMAGLCANPSSGLCATLEAEGEGGASIRRLLPLAVILPLVLGFLELRGRRAGLYDADFGLSLLVVLTAGLLTALVFWNGSAVERAEALRQSAEADAVRHARELEAFSYSVSHDLRAPLRAIDGFSQALLEDYGEKLDEEGKGHLARVRGGAQRMGQLIDDLLRLSRVSRSELRRARVDLSRLAKKVADELQRAEPGREVQFDIEDELVAEGDEQLLRVVLDNLIGNAWKFTSKKPNAHIELGTLPLAGGRRGFFVRDNGAGFEMTYAGKLFGAFQRLHGQGEFPGSGIGLATVQRVIHRHGGEVWAEGRVGEGATFYFTV